MNFLELIILLFFVPVLLIVSIFLLAKNRQKFPRTTSILVGVFFGSLGVFALFYTYSLFVQNQAILPIKMAAPFNREDHPFLFIVCIIFDTGFGLASLIFGMRTLSGHTLQSKSS